MRDGNEFLYDFKKRSDDAAAHNDGPSLTVQSEAEDADLNVIVARFGLTGRMPESVRVPSYGDFTGAPSDYFQALEFVESARDSFMTMPADVRARFDNDPGVFLAYSDRFSSGDGDVVKMFQDVGLAKIVQKSENTPNPVDVPPVKGDGENG